MSINGSIDRSGILATVGVTPLVRLQKLFPSVDTFAKLEMLNPGGSAKDRPALGMIERGLAEGVINSETVVVESSSGNMAIGLAQTCAYYGLRFVCVVDARTTPTNIKILRAYGAEVELIEQPDPVTGEFLDARLRRVHQIRQEIPNSFWPNQYENRANSDSHRQTMASLVAQLDRPPDYLFCAVSTCGTLRGCREYIDDNQLSTKIIAVDAMSSHIFGKPERPGKRNIPGHGAPITPGLYHNDLAHWLVRIEEHDCVRACRQLVRDEAILAGGSSGAVTRAALEFARFVAPGTLLAMVLMDRGDRYLDTVYDDQWVTDTIFGGREIVDESRDARDRPVDTQLMTL